MQTLKSQWRALVLILVVTCFAVRAESLSAQDAAAAAPVNNDPVFKVTSPQSDLKIVEKFAKLVEMPTRITTVFGFDPEVINVTKVEYKPNQIRVHAVAPGVTSLVLVDEKNETHTIEIFVTGDVRHLQAYINRLYPNTSVQAIAVRDSVVLRGWVTRPEHITHLVQIAEQFYPKVLNQMDVGGVQTIALKVKVIEAQRSKIRKFGFNFLFEGEENFISSTPGQIATLAQLSSGAPWTPASTIAGRIFGDDHTFTGLLEALKEESLLKILAEPVLVTTNGRPANMLAGGEFPILVPQSLGTTTIEWREFGVRLKAVPILLGGGRVRLQLEPEVSDRDFANSVQTNGVTVPGLTTRRVNTEVEMRFGETFMLAGLISIRNTAETSKVPFLGELPWIGAAFRRVSYDEGETEVVIMVTPELVGPMQQHQVLPGGPGQFTDVPTDRELYKGGHIEVPKYGDWCEDCQGGASNMMHPAGANPNYLPAAPAGAAAPIIPPAPGADGEPAAQHRRQNGGLSLAGAGTKKSRILRLDVTESNQPAVPVPDVTNAASSPSESNGPATRPGAKGRLIEPSPPLVSPSAGADEEVRLINP